MKQRLLFLFLTLLFGPAVFASHIIGGEMIYEFVKADTVAHTKTFKLTLRLFRDEHCGNCALMPDEEYIGVFNNDDRTLQGSYDVFKGDEGEVAIVRPACISDAPSLDYHSATYTIEVTLKDNQNGYTASYQTCCRVAPIENVENKVNSGSGTGSTYACFIPGTAQLGKGINSSPQFINSISTLCAGHKFSLNFSASDPDGDVLKYSYSSAYNGGRTVDPRPITPDPPPYSSVRYINTYSASNPLGNRTSIDPNTGIISGIAPPIGDYVVCVEIQEFRAGKQISIHRKDFIVNVSACDVAGASLKPNYAACDSFSYTFENENKSPLNKTYLWEFGDGSSSIEPTPIHQFSDTGVYSVRLTVNAGDPDCGESDTSKISVYPGFFPAFTFSECENNPTKFKDLTESRYGEVNSWSWYFGEEGVSNDTSHARNPVYTYPTTGKKAVSFIVTNTKGCVDTVNRDILILGRAFAGRDTTVVVGQILQLGASEGSSFAWLPPTDLNNTTLQNPTAVYSGNYDSIRYKVLIFNDPACLDSAFVTVHIYKTAPKIFVPTAFTPNGDGKNDLFRPVAAGIAKMDYIRVFNRWGEMVFSASSDREGWDGKIKGKEQPSGTFVWMVKGVDYLGKPFFEKGTVLLIR
jgi:gliding motility-associated-like protein